jgi:hypothetical protein
MDRLTPQKRKAIGMAFFGILLLILGLKFLMGRYPAGGQSIELSEEPTILFFNIDDPCDCMQELVQSADAQIAAWSEDARSGVPVQRINLEKRTDLGDQYKVFRVPCLILLNAQGDIVERQDYPLTEGGPLDLAKFELQIMQLIKLKRE